MRLYMSALASEGTRIAVCGVCSPGVQPGLGSLIRTRFEIDGPLVLFLGVPDHTRASTSYFSQRHSSRRRYPT